MRWMFLACLATACVEFEVSDGAAVMRVRPPAKPWGPVADPGVRDGEAGVVAKEGVPCGLGRGRCPTGERCQYDQAEDGTKGAAYCVDKDGEKTGNVPRGWWLR